MSKPTRQGLISIGPLRAFEAVSRLLSFSAAGEELHLTQSAISRQIRTLEADVDVQLFSRGTRHVELTAEGSALLRAVAPWIDRLDATVRQVRQTRGRKVVNVSTFASFASMWLIPQMEAFQRAHPDIDIRVQAGDALVDVNDSEIDLALRYTSPQRVPGHALRLFGEVLTPAISPWLAEQVRSGQAPALKTPADLVGHTLAEEDDHRPSAQFLSWRHWLRTQGQQDLQPRRWLYLNFTYQQVQAALGGQGVALARVALVAEQLQRGDLIEPFGEAGRITSPNAYWMIVCGASTERPEVRQFHDWVLERAAATRAVIGDVPPEASAKPAPRPRRRAR